MKKFQSRSLMAGVALAIVTVFTYWWMEPPRNPRIFAVGAAGILVSIASMLLKT